jgi:hypothetical protein
MSMFAVLSPVLLLLGSLVAPQETPAPPRDEASVEQDQSAPAAPAVPERRIESLFEGALIGARDREDFAETPGYRRLLEIVSNYREGELTQRVESRFDFPAALGDPDAWRGRVVSVRGMVADLEAARLREPIGDHVDAFRAFVTEADGSEGVVVDFLHDPPPLELQRDVVDVEAVFYRLLRYENRRGEMVDVPYLIARDVRRLEEGAPRKTLFDSMSMILIGAAVAFLIVRIFLSMRSKKTGASPSAERAARLLRERARSHTRPDAR